MYFYFLGEEYKNEKAFRQQHQITEKERKVEKEKREIATKRNLERIKKRREMENINKFKYFLKIQLLFMFVLQNSRMNKILNIIKVKFINVKLQPLQGY